MQLTNVFKHRTKEKDEDRGAFGTKTSEFMDNNGKIPKKKKPLSNKMVLSARKKAVMLAVVR